jgi:hypothetical protein
MSGFKGGCLCGAVRYESKADPMLAAHCHCVDCRKTSGTGHATHIVIPEDAFSFVGDVKVYDRPADSGNVVSRAFCLECGSAIYSINSGMPGMCFPRASGLDEPDLIAPTMVVYASRAASWDYVDPDLPSFETVPQGGPEAVIADHS